MRVANELRIVANKLEEIEENKNTLKAKEIWDLKNELELRLIKILEDWKICE